MFHNRTLNNKINKLQERALRLVYPDERLSFEELLQMDNSMTIHHRNVQRLAIEMFKVKHHISPLPVRQIFGDSDIPHDLRNRRYWAQNNIRTVRHGTETISFIGPKTWDIVPQYIKDSQSLIEFKSKIKQWKPTECSCRLCKIFVPELGFL